MEREQTLKLNSLQLPDANTIMAKLREVYDEPFTVQHFYESVAKHAGDHLNSLGFASMLVEEVANVSRSMQDLSSTVAALWVENIPKYLEKFFSGDDLSEGISFFREAIAKAKAMAAR